MPSDAARMYIELERYVDRQQPTHRTHRLHSRARFINSRWRNLTHCISGPFYYIVSSRALRADARLIFYETEYRVCAMALNYRRKYRLPDERRANERITSDRGLRLDFLSVDRDPLDNNNYPSLM